MADVIELQQILDAYAQALRNYLATEKALAEAETVTIELVHAHDLAGERFHELRRIYRQSARATDAIQSALEARS